MISKEEKDSAVKYRLSSLGKELRAYAYVPEDFAKAVQAQASAEVAAHGPGKANVENIHRSLKQRIDSFCKVLSMRVKPIPPEDVKEVYSYIEALAQPTFDYLMQQTKDAPTLSEKERTAKIDWLQGQCKGMLLNIRNNLELRIHELNHEIVQKQASEVKTAQPYYIAIRDPNYCIGKPFLGKYGAVVFEADNEEHARELIDSDPYSIRDRVVGRGPGDKVPIPKLELESVKVTGIQDTQARTILKKARELGKRVRLPYMQGDYTDEEYAIAWYCYALEELDAGRRDVQSGKEEKPAEGKKRKRRKARKAKAKSHRSRVGEHFRAKVLHILKKAKCPISRPDLHQQLENEGVTLPGRDRDEQLRNITKAVGELKGLRYNITKSPYRLKSKKRR